MALKLLVQTLAPLIRNRRTFRSSRQVLAAASQFVRRERPMFDLLRQVVVADRMKNWSTREQRKRFLRRRGILPSFSLFQVGDKFAGDADETLHLPKADVVLVEPKTLFEVDGAAVPKEKLGAVEAVDV